MAASTKILINNYSIENRSADTDTHWRIRLSNYKHNDIEMWYYYTKTISVSNRLGSVYYGAIKISFPVTVKTVVFICGESGDPNCWGSITGITTTSCNFILWRGSSYSVTSSVYIYVYAEL